VLGGSSTSAPVNAVTKIRALCKTGNLPTSWGSQLLKKTLLHGINNTNCTKCFSYNFRNEAILRNPDVKPSLLCVQCTRVGCVVDVSREHAASTDRTEVCHTHITRFEKILSSSWALPSVWYSEENGASETGCHSVPGKRLELRLRSRGLFS
jgi:hypothetical protein